MNEQGLQTSFWVMILVQTIGSVDMPGSGERKMPAPRQYIAILLTWLVLQLIAGISAGAARATAALGWLLVLSGLVLGPFGKQTVNLFTVVAQRFSPTSTSGQLGQAEASAVSGPLSTLTPFPPASAGIPQNGS